MQKVEILVISSYATDRRPIFPRVTYNHSFSSILNIRSLKPNTIRSLIPKKGQTIERSDLTKRVLSVRGKSIVRSASSTKKLEVQQQLVGTRLRSTRRRLEEQ